VIYVPAHAIGPAAGIPSLAGQSGVAVLIIQLIYVPAHAIGPAVGVPSLAGQSGVPA
jgi:hypothetical protein